MFMDGAEVRLEQFLKASSSAETPIALMFQLDSRRLVQPRKAR